MIGCNMQYEYLKDEPLPIDFIDFDYPDHLTGYFVLRKKEIAQKLNEHESDQYEILALHPDNAKPGYRMLITYIMHRDQLIEFVKSTTYRIVSIRKL